MLWVKGSKTGVKNFARLYLGVLIEERIGLNLGTLSTTGLWAFGLLYRIPGLEPTGKILCNSSLLILLLPYKLLKKISKIDEINQNSLPDKVDLNLT